MLTLSKCKVKHLPRCHLDHCPVLMEASHIRPINLIKPFRFQEFWLLDIFFPNVVSQAWSRGRGLVNCMDNFSKDASVWNKNHFGNIHYKKRELLTKSMGCRKPWPPTQVLTSSILRNISTKSLTLSSIRSVISGP